MWFYVFSKLAVVWRKCVLSSRSKTKTGSLTLKIILFCGGSSLQNNKRGSSSNAHNAEWLVGGCFKCPIWSKVHFAHCFLTSIIKWVLLKFSLSEFLSVFKYVWDPIKRMHTQTHTPHSHSHTHLDPFCQPETLAEVRRSLAVFTTARAQISF